MSQNTPIRAIGCMTGTSCDGVDAALVEVDTAALTGRFIDDASVSLETLRQSGGESLGTRLRMAREQRPLAAHEFALLARDASHATIEAIRPLVDRHGTPDLIALHGQTLVHAPPLSWPLCDPWSIAAAFRTRVVYDLRAADLAEGGQGAPLVPFADWVLLRAPSPRAVLNLGGFANVTMLPAATAHAASGAGLVQGGDLCACCQFLDGLSREVLGAPFDRDGSVAGSGTPQASFVEDLIATLTPSGEGSLGTSSERDARRSVAAALASGKVQALGTADLLASAAVAVASTITNQINRIAARTGAATPADCLVAGGGARHAVLIQQLERRLGIPVHFTDAAGVPARARESAAWAVLGACRGLHGVTLASVTGRRSFHLVDGAEIRPSAAESTDPHAT
ncbi:MAG: anhydro-N-acetylmuramic acid kinase [Planctomycetota bacterium]|nr:anhydro-N-acetylmuramic acid kinase [Planctomycetota bacterium]MDA1105491.1 anhydro-N-acetylmuramic acid kinase [Planctomycetota bacterium]